MADPNERHSWMEPISVRIPEAVRLTGLSRSRLYELMKSKEIEFVKVGSSTLIPFDSLRGFIERQRSVIGTHARP
jgi:excisionase family DNA binding protein